MLKVNHRHPLNTSEKLYLYGSSRFSKHHEMNLKLSFQGLIFLCFWIFGLVNNVLYVVILSAAVDLVGPSAPKAIILLADVMPSFIFKLTAPFFIHKIPYNFRIGMLVALSFFGMLIIAFSDALFLKLSGIILASLSSGMGETTFLQLTHYYDKWALAGFSSGTGAAGLAGSFVFLVLTVWIGLSTTDALVMFSVIPFLFAVVYGGVLPSPAEKYKFQSYQPIEEDGVVGEAPSVIVEGQPEDSTSTNPNHVSGFQATFSRVYPLFLPYMLPLILVYIGEYVINQGISPTLLFPLEELPFSRFRDVYVTYGTLYQLGVFISRSSSPFFRVRKLYAPAFLQLINLFICILQSLYVVIPNVYLMFGLIFYEGLLGGLAYVNTFLLVSESVPPKEREFAMGATTVSDSAGIVIAALISLWLEKALCRFQIDTGRPWCEMN